MSPDVNLKGSALPADPKIPENAKVNHQQLLIFEGFKPNGLQIRIQRKELRIVTPVKIDFDDLLKNIKFRYFDI